MGSMVVCTKDLSLQLTALSSPNMLIHWLVQLVCAEAVQMAAASVHVIFNTQCAWREIHF